jgi:hypothetical protein
VVVLEVVNANKSAVSSNVRPPSSNSALPWWLFAVVGLGAVLLGTGGVIALLRPAMLVSPHDEINGAVRIYAGYVTSRNLSLAIMLLAALWLRSKNVLSTLTLLVALIQFLDAVIDVQEGRWMIVPGIVVLGALFLYGSARLSGHPFWKIGAWKHDVQGR